MRKTIYFNNEYLPTKNEPQIIITLCYPTIKKWYIDFDTNIGFDKSEERFVINFIILGFGIMYNRNWDV